jgi:hypothetical protein
VRKLLLRDVEAWQWERVAANSECPVMGHLREGAVLQPLRRLLGVEASGKQAEQLTGKQKAYLRSVLVHGQWPMHRLHKPHKTQRRIKHSASGFSQGNLAIKRSLLVLAQECKTQDFSTAH